MATVTGFTADRMLSIENSCVVEGEVVGDNLVLKTRGGEDIPAGNVRGPKGDKGDVGEISESQLNSALSSLVPAGVILDYVGESAPDTWLAINGQTITNGQSLYPNLWAVLPESMKSGSNIIFPDTRGRVSVCLNVADADFNTPGKIGGSKTHKLTVSELPPHTHTQNPHTHTQNPHTHSQNPHTHPQSPHIHLGTTLANGEHFHETLKTSPTGGGGSTRWVLDSTGMSSWSSTQPAHTHNFQTNATTATNMTFTATNNNATATNNNATATNQNTGGDNPHNNLQPYICFMKIIKT